VTRCERKATLLCKLLQIATGFLGHENKLTIGCHSINGPRQPAAHPCQCDAAVWLYCSTPALLLKRHMSYHILQVPRDVVDLWQQPQSSPMQSATGCTSRVLCPGSTAQSAAHLGTEASSSTSSTHWACQATATAVGQGMFGGSSSSSNTLQNSRAFGTAVGTPTLSQLLQHPVLTSALSPGQQQQQQYSQQLLDKALPQQLLQQYQQEHPQLVHELQQQLQAATLQGGAVQQQRQQQALSTGTGLPELRQSESPQPPGQLGNGTQQDSPGSSAALSALPAAGLGVLAAAGSGLGISSTSLGGQTLHRSRYQQSQHSQQLLPDAASGLTASRSSVGGVSAAASKVLQAAAPSFYNGAGPLTSGMRPAWSSSNQGRGVQAGADLAQVGVTVRVVATLFAEPHRSRTCKSAKWCKLSRRSRIGVALRCLKCWTC